MVNNIDDVLGKLEQMRESIRLSDEIFPIIGDLFMFIKEIIPLMLEINTFMNDSSEKIPTASENINKVSKTTELATQEVLDKLDVIIDKLDSLKSDLKKDGLEEKYGAVIDEITNDSSEIIYAFQFQDITTQQLEHVNRILEAIYKKFVLLFESSLKLKDKSAFGRDVMQAIEGEMQKEKLKKTSDFFMKETEDKMHQNGISQDAIDELFK